jgi:hypothetical protein
LLTNPTRKKTTDGKKDRFRRWIEQYQKSARISKRCQSGQLEGPRLLRRVWVPRSRIDAQFLEHLPAQTVMGQHPLYSLLHNSLWPMSQKIGKGPSSKASGISRMVVIDLLLAFSPSNHDLFGVDHHHMITVIQVRGESGLPFASQQHGDLSGQATKNLSLGIDEIPFSLNLAGLQTKGLHASPKFNYT